jgi:hypothetical protein
MAPTVIELGEERLLAAQRQDKARLDYEDIRHALARKGIDSSADASALAALTAYENAQAQYEEARRAHGRALAADLQFRERGG